MMKSQTVDRLKLCLQKSGRLSEDSFALLKECGIHLSQPGRKLKSITHDFPLECYYLRDDDIPHYLNEDIAHLGIIGLNTLLESTPTNSLKIIKKLGFAKCRLSIAGPLDYCFKDLSDLEGKRIATSYPTIVSKFLADHHLKASVHPIAGSVEIAPSVGLADFIVDLVSSGSTLMSNGLKEHFIILESEAVLVQSSKLEQLAHLRPFLEEFIFRIETVLSVKDAKYILMNAPGEKINEIIKILPSIKSPTITPLGDTGWYSISSVISQNEFWQLAPKLKMAQAQGILLLPIEKMVP